MALMWASACTPPPSGPHPPVQELRDSERTCEVKYISPDSRRTNSGRTGTNIQPHVTFNQT